MRRFLLLLAATLLLSAGAAYLLFLRDMTELNARITGRSQSVALSSGIMEFAEAGSGEPLLVIHGSGGGFDQGLEMGAALASGYRLIAPSRFGYLGSSYPEGASPERQADAFVELMDRLGLGSVIIFGGSAGALSALQLAIRHPERCRALVLFVPASHSPDRAPNTSAVQGTVGEAAMRTVLGSDLIFWLGLTLAPDAMTRMLLATDPGLVRSQPPVERERVRSILRHILPIHSRAKGLLLDMSTAGAPPPYRLERITCPVLAISAVDDYFGTAASAAHAAKSVPNGKLILYPTGGHILAGRQAEVWPAILSFLKEAAIAPDAPAADPANGDRPRGG